MRFRYLRDPVFLSSVLLYLVNRFLLKPNSSHWFIHSYVNDFLCVPMLVPVTITLGRFMRFRRHDGPPNTMEIVFPVLIWSVLFEIVFPELDFWNQWVFGDPFDILCYCSSAVVAAHCWKRLYVPVNPRKLLPADKPST